MTLRRRWAFKRLVYRQRRRTEENVSNFHVYLMKLLEETKRELEQTSLTQEFENDDELRVQSWAIDDSVMT